MDGYVRLYALVGLLYQTSPKVTSTYPLCYCSAQTVDIAFARSRRIERPSNVEYSSIDVSAASTKTTLLYVRTMRQTHVECQWQTPPGADFAGVDAAVFSSSSEVRSELA